MKCINCENNLQTKDIFCRKCGIRIEHGGYYIFLNIFIFIFVAVAIGLVVLLIASFLI